MFGDLYICWKLVPFDGRYEMVVCVPLRPVSGLSDVCVTRCLLTAHSYNTASFALFANEYFPRSVQACRYLMCQPYYFGGPEAI